MNGGEIVCAVADRQGHVVIGVGPRRQSHELVPRRVAHRLDHARIVDAGRHDLLVDHPLPLGGEVDRPGRRQSRRPARRPACSQDCET